MNKLPLSPTDVTEFTCNAAQSLDLMARHAATAFGNRCFAQEAIATEWAHCIAVEAAEAQRMIDSDTIDVYEAGRVKRDAVLVASRAYVAWLDSLKGGQNG